MFYLTVQYVIYVLLKIIGLGVTAFAVIHCIRQRSDAFTAIGTLPKGGWLVVLILALPVIYIWGVLGGTLFLPIGLLFFGAALFYVLDVRAGIKELLEGRW